MLFKYEVKCLGLSIGMFCENLNVDFLIPFSQVGARSRSLSKLQPAPQPCAKLNDISYLRQSIRIANEGFSSS